MSKENYHIVYSHLRMQYFFLSPNKDGVTLQTNQYCECWRKKTGKWNRMQCAMVTSKGQTKITKAKKVVQTKSTIKIDYKSSNLYMSIMSIMRTISRWSIAIIFSLWIIMMKQIDRVVVINWFSRCKFVFTENWSRFLSVLIGYTENWSRFLSVLIGYMDSYSPSYQVDLRMRNSKCHIPDMCFLKSNVW